MRQFSPNRKELERRRSNGERESEELNFCIANGIMHRKKRENERNVS